MTLRFPVVSTLIALSLVAPTPAWADAATHQLRLVARNVGSSCVITAALTNVHRPSPPIKVALVYSPTHNEEPEAQIDFAFPALTTGATAKTTDHITFRCGQVSINKVEVTCSEAAEHCPGFVYVQVPALTAPRLRAQKVEGR